MPLPLDRLKGSIPPLITPFKNGEVDYETYARLVEFQIVEG
jgi:4-hydroxy-tetrahydrodipicolinate synthase